MTTIELKSNLNKLINTINNDSVLSEFYAVLKWANQTKVGCYGADYLLKRGGHYH